MKKFPLLWHKKKLRRRSKNTDLKNIFAAFIKNPTYYMKSFDEWEDVPMSTSLSVDVSQVWTPVLLAFGRLMRCRISLEGQIQNLGKWTLEDADVLSDLKQAVINLKNRKTEADVERSQTNAVSDVNVHIFRMANDTTAEVSIKSGLSKVSGDALTDKN